MMAHFNPTLQRYGTFSSSESTASSDFSIDPSDNSDTTISHKVTASPGPHYNHYSLQGLFFNAYSGLVRKLVAVHDHHQKCHNQQCTIILHRRITNSTWILAHAHELRAFGMRVDDVYGLHHHKFNSLGDQGVYPMFKRTQELYPGIDGPNRLGILESLERRMCTGRWREAAFVVEWLFKIGGHIPFDFWSTQQGKSALKNMVKSSTDETFETPKLTITGPVCAKVSMPFITNVYHLSVGYAFPEDFVVQEMYKAAKNAFLGKDELWAKHPMWAGFKIRIIIISSDPTSLEPAGRARVYTATISRAWLKTVVSGKGRTNEASLDGLPTAPIPYGFQIDRSQWLWLGTYSPNLNVYQADILESSGVVDRAGFYPGSYPGDFGVLVNAMLEPLYPYMVKDRN
ncbi:hypothetical protein K402DRAFT_456492 [Aulographum hederae CBS 113979]|uniref:Uncharacterized protein n=1 Tax=Aulographum hederae CBS 113979 TaxID=1176131 RepID=A0A6G1GRF2_9PEZI|nr:hypothetical protein K402DRAFT_456492 [Aulographum hederae CBS 113979]